MNNPLVSIIIPTYNRAHLIGETLDSVLAQTYENWECIIVDDGSIDNSEEVIQTYVTKDNRFQYHKRPLDRLKGANACRNYGFELSKGEYVNWFDSDDIMLNGFIEDKIKKITKSNCEVVFCSYTYFTDSDIQDRISNSKFSGNVLDDLIENRINFSPLSFMFQRDIIKNTKYNVELAKAQDLDFIFRVFTSLPQIRIGHEPKVLFKVRKHTKSISNSLSKNGIEYISRLYVHKLILQYFTDKNNIKGIIKYQKLCLVDLKILLENKNYIFVIKEIFKISFLSFYNKCLLLFHILLFYVTNRGSNKFKTIIID